MPRWRRYWTLVALWGLCGTASAHAQPPPCPAPTTIMHSGSLAESDSLGVHWPINLAPCETVLVEMTGSAGPHPSAGSNIYLDIYNAAGTDISYNWFTCGPSCSQSVPFPDSISGYPLPGTRGISGLAKEIVVTTGAFNFFSAPRATYSITIRKQPRPLYNMGGTGLNDAPLVQLPTTVFGSVHWSEPGQFYKVRLNPQQGFYASGFARAHRVYGAYWGIDVLDSAGALLNRIYSNALAGGPSRFSSLNPFTNTGSQAADFYVKVWSPTWPLYDFGINLVPFAITTEVSEVGFKLDYLITSWKDRHPIDSPDGTMPTWIKGRDLNDPAAYRMGMRPTLFAVVSINPPFGSSTSVSVRVKKSGTIVGTRTGLTFVGSTGLIDTLSTDTDLETSPSVQGTNYRLDWEWSLDGGANWTSIGQTGPHRIYWTYDAPIAPPFTNQPRETGPLFDPTYDLALDKATEAAASSAEPTQIKQRLNLKLKELIYNPSVVVAVDGHHPLEVYDHQTGQCDDMAHLMRGLLRSVGIGTETWYVWGGGPGPGGEQAYWYAYQYPVTFRVQRLEEDGVPPNPHFSFHAVVGDSPTGVLYDPSYGITATGPFVGLDETLDSPTGPFVSSPALVRQIWRTVLTLTPTPTSLLTCPHVRPSRPFAGFVDQSVPASMIATQSYPLRMVFRNTGTDTWQMAQGFALRPADDATAAVWGSINVPLPNAVISEDEVTFTFSVTAPATAGRYPISFRVQQNGTMFGSPSAPVIVDVQ